MISVNTDLSLIKEKAPALSIPLPLFAQYKPDFLSIKKLAKKYKTKKNIILIGNGGSITSFYFFYKALGTKKNIYTISTMEPDVLSEAKKKCKKKDTVVIAVSKSGNTVGVIESLLYFIDYTIITVTENKPSALKKIQELYEFDFIEHPPVGGRYSGFTPSGLLPAAIAGLDIESIWKGAEKAYKNYSPTNNKRNAAKELAHQLYELNKKKYREIFMPIYSSKLLSSRDIIVQLIHESVGKKGKSPTVIAAFAPESQHHTNQRFFGGKKNMVACFVTVEKCETRYGMVKVPSKLKEIPIRDGTLNDLDGNFYCQALKAEYEGTKQDAKNKKLPNITVQLSEITPETIGYYLAFWHYTTVYLCKLHGVDAFNQPEVENSKKISFELRKKKHSLQKKINSLP